MPSATTADSSDSMAPSRAKATASGSTACTFSSEKSGRCGDGSSAGMPPKRLPMVSTGKAKAKVATAATATAISMPGQCGLSFLAPTIRPMVSSDSATAAGLIVSSDRASVSILAMKAAGSLPSSLSPSRSFTWLAKMMTAMPAVKPTVTG